MVDLEMWTELTFLLRRRGYRRIGGLVWGAHTQPMHGGIRGIPGVRPGPGLSIQEAQLVIHWVLGQGILLALTGQVSQHPVDRWHLQNIKLWRVISLCFRWDIRLYLRVDYTKNWYLWLCETCFISNFAKGKGCVSKSNFYCRLLANISARRHTEHCWAQLFEYIVPGTGLHI